MANTTIKLRKVQERLTFQENMRLVALPDGNPDESGLPSKRYMSVRGAWVPGTDLPFADHEYGYGPDKKAPPRHFAAFGGHVYSQAGLAASRAFRETMMTKMMRRSDGSKSDNKKKKKYGIHTTHGIFSSPGLTDRPYIYTVTILSPSPSFPSLLVTVRQPTTPSTNPLGDHYSPSEDSLLPLGPICFTSTVTFRPYYPSSPSPPPPPPSSSHSHHKHHQIPSIQTRFAPILQQHILGPRHWDYAPMTDLDWITSSLKEAAAAAAAGDDNNNNNKSQKRNRIMIQGTFPGIEMRKVDLTDWNAGKPLWERREILLYRLLAPLPSSSESEDGEGGGIGGGGVDAHIMCHAFEADRNGLLMVGNHLGFGREYGRAASLTYTFVVHVDAGDAVMRYVPDEEADTWEGGGGGWWIQEAMFPRIGEENKDGRAVLMSRIWSPEGVHVATEYQDGIIRRRKREEKGEKL